MKLSSALLCLVIGNTTSSASDKHVHGMKKLREQAFSHINAQLLDSSNKHHGEKGPKLPNPRFIFHNKIPKSGSTTLANIVHTLEVKNNFKLRHFHPCVEEPCDKLSDGRAHSDKMVRSIRPDLKRATPDAPLMVIKHHLYTNFTMYGMEEPTWINVAREPVSRFVSSYYFRRYGFNRHSGARNKKVLDGQWSVDMDLEECVDKGAPECSDESNQAFLEYICGSPEIWPECQAIAGVNMEKTLERAKEHVMRNYLVIGVLEDFDNTLRLFERLIPSIFNGAKMVYDDIGAEISNQTSTSHKHEITAEARRKLELGPLRYQVDLYNMIKKLYNEKLVKYGITK